MDDLARPPAPHELADRLAIHDCIARQALGNDTLDAELWKSVFWPDATESHAWFEGNAHAFVAETIPMLQQQMRATWHQLGLPLVTIDGQSARAVTYFFAYCRMRAAEGETPTDLTSGGRYIDRFEKRGETWRILRRVTKADWVRTDPASFVWGRPTMNGHIPRMGMWDADDPARVLFGRVMTAKPQSGEGMAP
jgi:hypothetical protein